MIKAPCKDCNDRCAQCRSFCADWKQYEQKKQEQYAARRLAQLSTPQPSPKSLRSMKQYSKK